MAAHEPEPVKQLGPEDVDSSGITAKHRHLLELAISIACLAVIITCAVRAPGHRSEDPPRVVNPHAPLSPPALDDRSLESGQPEDGGVLGEAKGGTGARADTVADPWQWPLERFRSAVQALRHGTRKESIRILWMGDSHVAADYWPEAVRSSLSDLLPIAGPGYLLLGLRNYRHGRARVSREGDFDAAPHPLANRSIEADGIFGLAGVRTTPKDSSGSITVRLPSGIAQERVDYRLVYRLPRPGDALTVRVGKQHHVLREDGHSTEDGVAEFKTNGKGNQAFNVSVTSGRPELFGLVAETARPGLVIDTLGINGARFGTPLAWDEASWVTQVRQRRPDLVMVGYGTNEVFDSEAVARHAHRLELLIGRLRSAAPEADCVVIGPTDVGRGGETAQARVASIDEAEEATADGLGCAYFSPYRLMIEDGGFSAWQSADPPLALPDKIHLTVKGYSVLGEALARHLRGDLH